MTALKTIPGRFSPDLLIAGRVWTLGDQFRAALLAIFDVPCVHAIRAAGADSDAILSRRIYTSCTQGKGATLTSVFRNPSRCPLAFPLFPSRTAPARKRGGLFLRQDDSVTGRGLMSNSFMSIESHQNGRVSIMHQGGGCNALI